MEKLFQLNKVSLLILSAYTETEDTINEHFKKQD
jgi:hypothetical protein